MGIRISSLTPNAIPYTGSEKIPLVQSNETRAGTVSSLVNYLSGDFAFVNRSNTFVGDQTIVGNLSVGTLSATLIDALSTRVTYIDIRQFELSGFDIRGNFNIIGKLSATDDTTINGGLTASKAVLFDVNTSLPALEITQRGTGHSFLVEDELNDTTPFVITSGGDVGIGTSTPSAKLTVSGSLSGSGVVVFDTSSNEPALRVTQRGNGAAIRVEDGPTADTTPFIVAGDGKVGIGFESPTEALTVSGNITATQIIYDRAGNSTNWNNVYTSVAATSADWDSTRTTVFNTSANWNSTRTSVFNLSADWNSTRTTVFNTSADWNSTRTSVFNTSADWNSTRTSVNASSANWNSTRTTVFNTSADWNSTRTTVFNLSTTWEESADIIPTVNNYLSTNNILLSCAAVGGTTLVVTSSGNVGIGTNTPTEKLYVNGAIYIGGATTSMSSVGSQTDPLQFVDESNRTNTYAIFGPAGGGNDWGYLRQIGSSDFHTISLDLHDDDNLANSGSAFAIRKVASYGQTPPAPDIITTAFYINGINNIGIGLSAPNEKLTVSGNISSSNVIYSKTSNSDNWSNVYSSVVAASASWNTTSMNINNANTNVTLTLNDAFTYIRLTNSSSITITVPVLSWVAGTTITFRRTTGAGAVSLSLAGGVTVNDDDTVSVGPGDVFGLKYLGSNTWDFI